MMKHKLNSSTKYIWNKMNKVVLSLIFIISAALNAQEGQRSDFSFSASLVAGLGQYLSDHNIEREAAARIARQKAEEELARLNAQKEAILKERIEALKLLAEGTWWLISNGAKVSYRIIAGSGKFIIETVADTANTICELNNIESVIQKIKANDKKTIRGCIGITTLVAFAWYKYNQSKKPSHKPDNNDYDFRPLSFNPHSRPNLPVDLDKEFADLNPEAEGQPYIPGGHQ